jgi:hypothetical protein
MSRRECLIATPAVAALSAMLLAAPAYAEESDFAALAAAVAGIPTTLEKGLQASESAGKPISGKFEIEEDGKLQLSVYTMATDSYNEVVVAPDSGNVVKTEKITDTDDLKAATEQKAAMEKSTVTLAAVTERAVQRNSGSRAVSIFPELKGGLPIASVTLLRDGKLTTVSEKLD